MSALGYKDCSITTLHLEWQKTIDMENGYGVFVSKLEVKKYTDTRISRLANHIICIDSKVFTCLHTYRPSKYSQVCISGKQFTQNLYIQGA